MSRFSWRQIGAGVLALGAALIVYFFVKGEDSPPENLKNEVLSFKRETIGQSLEGRNIEAYIFGEGDVLLVFVGGIHGGYEWNSVVLAYDFIDYFKNHPEFIPEELKVAVIPDANPDGVYKVIGKEGKITISDVLPDVAREPGRFNSRGVDINRNFDCKWKPKGVWRGRTVSAGAKPFSEPEAAAIRDFVLRNNPAGVVFWHSQANAVYASECEKGILPATREIMEAYSLGSGYRPIESFDAYEVTGDAEGWLASVGIPAITVELKTHEDVEWERNLNGVREVFRHYADK